MEKIKQVIIIRKDLHMSKGKFCAQASHGVLSAIMNLMEEKNDKLILDLKKHKIIKEWLNSGQTKIALYCESEIELLSIYQQAKDANLICSLITDAGHTEFKNIPTKTVTILGPDTEEKLNKITGHLKLL